MAVFNEVLQIKAPLEPFQESLREIKKEWEKFKGEVGSKDASKLFGAGATNNLASALKDLRSTFEQVAGEIVKGNADVKQSYTNLQQAIQTLAAGTKKAEIKAAKETTEALAEEKKKQVDAAEKAAAKEVAAAEKKSKKQQEAEEAITQASRLIRDRQAQRSFGLFGKEQLGQQTASDVERVPAAVGKATERTKELREAVDKVSFSRMLRSIENLEDRLGAVQAKIRETQVSLQRARGERLTLDYKVQKSETPEGVGDPALIEARNKALQKERDAQIELARLEKQRDDIQNSLLNKLEVQDRVLSSLQAKLNNITVKRQLEEATSLGDKFAIVDKAVKETENDLAALKRQLVDIGKQQAALDPRNAIDPTVKQREAEVTKQIVAVEQSLSQLLTQRRGILQAINTQQQLASKTVKEMRAEEGLALSRLKGLEQSGDALGSKLQVVNDTMAVFNARLLQAEATARKIEVVRHRQTATGVIRPGEEQAADKLAETINRIKELQTKINQIATLRTKLEEQIAKQTESQAEALKKQAAEEERTRLGLPPEDVARVNAEIDKLRKRSQELNFGQQVSAVKQLQERLALTTNEIRVQRGEYTRAATEARKLADSGKQDVVTRTRLQKALADQVAAQELLIKLQAQQLHLERQITSEKRNQHNFVEQILFGGGGAGHAGGLRGTLAHLIRFYALWNLINGAVSLFGTLLAAPFKLLALGIGYMRETERAADDMVGVIASNAVFSKDYAENFRAAKAASMQVTKELDRQAILTGFTAEKLEGTFKALMTSGAGRFASTLEQMVELATMFQMSLNATGSGGLAAQTSIQELTALFSGRPSKDNKFLAFLQAKGGLPVGEWQQILKNAEKYRDLVPQLAQRIKPFKDAIIEAGKGQQVLLNTLQLNLRKVTGDGVAIIFDKLNTKLIALNKYLLDNRAALSRWLGALAILFLRVVDWVEKLAYKLLDLATNPEILDRFIENAVKLNTAFEYVAETVGNVFLALLGASGVLTNMLVTIARFSWSPSNFFSAEGMKETKRDMKDVQDDFMFFVEKFGRAMRHVTTGGDIQKNAIELGKTLRRELGKIGDEGPSFLKKLYGLPDGPSNSKIDLIPKIKEEFDTVKAYLQQELEKAEQQAAITREVIQRRVEAGELNVFQQAQEEAEIAAKLFRRQLNIFKVLDTVIRDTQRKISAQSNVNQERSEIEVERLNQELIKKNRDLAKAQFEATKDIIDAQTKAIKEGREADAESAKGALERIALEQSKAIEEIAAAREAGYLTEREALLATEEVRQVQFNAEIYRLTQLRDAYAAGQAEFVRYNEQIKTATKDRQLTVDLFNRALLVATEKELARERESLAVKQQLDAELKNIVATISEMMAQTDRLTSAQYAAIEAQRLSIQQAREETERQYELARAKSANTEETMQLANQLRRQTQEQIALETSLIAARTRGLPDGIRQWRVRQETRAAIGRLTPMRQTLEQRQGEVEEQLKQVLPFEEFNRLQAESSRLAIVISMLEKAISDLTDTFDKAKFSFKEFFTSAADVLFGPGFVELWQGAKGSVEKFGLAIAGAGGLISTVRGFIDTFKRGREEGGTLGGVGAVASQFGQMLGGTAGFIIAGVGQIFSFVGGLFKAAARKLADSLKKDFDLILKDFSRGNLTLVQALSQLEAKRAQAITQLSGKKGGKEELNKILPTFDDEIESLKKQQKDIITNFEQALDVLRLNSDTLGSMVEQWKQINDQVREYIGAGGDAGKAAEFLSIKLGQIREDALSSLADAEQEAIQAALRLNELLEQRNQLTEDFRRKEFDLITADALERRQAGSIQRGRELVELRKQYEEDLAAIDKEITMTSIRVDKEREIFQLSTDIAELRRRDEELTLAALDKQIQKWIDLKQIVASILPSGSGWVGAGLFGPQNVNIEINIPITPGEWPDEDDITRLGDTLVDEMTRRLRMVPA